MRIQIAARVGHSMAPYAEPDGLAREDARLAGLAAVVAGLRRCFRILLLEIQLRKY